MRALVKVNLTLHVGAVRPDGYHPVSSVCLFPAIGDDVSLGPPSDGFALSVGGPEAAALRGLAASDNLVSRAARLLAERTELQPRRLRLTKAVPAAAGIAGGTADAATALVLLNREARKPLSEEALIALSRGIGADGPVCTAAMLAGGGAWLAEGDGDRVRRLDGPPSAWLVLANARRPVPTGRVFAAFDRAGGNGSLAQARLDVGTMAGLVAAGRGGRNDLRGPALRVDPAIAALERAVAFQPGCLLSRMSGSGGTVFGLFASRLAATRAERALARRDRWVRSGPLLGA